MTKVIQNNIRKSEKGANNGVATLDGSGKLPASQLPTSAQEWKGNWNANTNTPTLASGVGTNGDEYKVSVAGTTNLDGENDWAVGDILIFNGTVWEKSSFEIQDGSVDNAKLADQAQATIKGRAAGAGTGVPQDLTAAQVRAILNVEDGATADQTDAEIKTAYENNSNTNAFTDALLTKLNGIESNATADQSNAEIETAYNAQVSIVSQAEAEAGTATTVRRWTAQRVKQAIDALASSGSPTLSKTVTIESPTTADTQIIFMRTDVAITVQQTIGVLVGSSTPSVTVNVIHDPNTSLSGNDLVSAQNVTSTNTGDSLPMSDTTIPADSWIWIEVTAQSGTVDYITLDIRYTED